MITRKRRARAIVLPTTERKGWYFALSSTAIYLFTGFAWIVASDLISVRLASSKEVLARIQLIKGAGFVLITALLVYYLIFRSVRAVDRSRELYRSLFTDNEAVMFLIDPVNYTVLDTNDAAEAFAGRPVSELTGTRVYQLFAREPDETTSPGFTTRGNMPIITRFRIADGSYRDVEVYRATIELRPQRFTVLVVHDITERKLADSALLRAKEELEHRVLDRTAELAAINAELESFSYSVSHDLRAPLRAIQGFAEILSRRNKNQLDEEGQRHVDHIVTSAKRMDRLVDDLLDYARLGRRSVDRTRVSLGTVFRAIVSDLGDLIRDSGATVTIPESLPEIAGDETLLRQAFLNLIVNALTYRKPDEPARVWVEADESEDRVVISVHDRGIGIAAEFYEKIFAPFQRLHTEGRYPGTGIGLATVRKATTLLGGRVEVRSTVGEGSTFTVTLPKE